MKTFVIRLIDHEQQLVGGSLLVVNQAVAHAITYTKAVCIQLLEPHDTYRLSHAYSKQEPLLTSKSPTKRWLHHVWLRVKLFQRVQAKRALIGSFTGIM